MPKVLRRLKLDEISLVDAPANPHARVMLAKREAAKKQDGGEAPVQCRLCDTAVGKDDKFCKSCGAPFYKAQNKETEVDDKETKKTAPATGDLAELEKMLDELKKVEGAGEGEATVETRTLRRMVTKIIDERKVAVFTKKAEALKALPGTTISKLAVLMKDISEQAPEAWSRLEPLLKSWHEAFEMSELFSEKGGSGADGGTAEERVLALAQGRINKGQAKDMTEAQGQVFKADPALYAEYRREKQVRIGARA